MHSLEGVISWQKSEQKLSVMPSRPKTIGWNLVSASSWEMQFTMGEGIYGHGVNIATRAEILAKEGRICISGTAFDQVRKKLNTQVILKCTVRGLSG